jgi:sulfite reductase alpha subunit-like flavoprotein
MVVFLLKTNLLETLEQMGKGRNERASLNSQLPPPAYRVTVSEATFSRIPDEEEWRCERFILSYNAYFMKISPLTAYKYQSSSKVPFNNVTSGVQTPLLAKVITNERITATDWMQNTRHVELEVECTSGCNPTALPYHAGDVASVLPSNSQNDVDRFLSVLPSDLAQLADNELLLEFIGPNVSGLTGCSFWPTRCTLRGWLTHCSDIHALPEREDLRALAAYCSLTHEHGSSQHNKLIGLSGTSEAALYADYILREKRTWVDVFYDFDSIRAPGSKLTIEALLGLVGPIRPRDFSIASSPTQSHLLPRNGNSSVSDSLLVELCVAVVEGKTPLGRHYNGLCSHYIDKLEPSQSIVRMWIRPGSFHSMPLELSQSHPYQFDAPVLFIGAGTGIAPLRGLIREREAVRKLTAITSVHNVVPILTTSAYTEGEADCDNILLFGCRKEAADFYYKNEWAKLANDNRLLLMTAFSQDQWHKIYVQQILKMAETEHSLLTRHVLVKKGTIFIAGGPNMARAIKEEIIEILTASFGGDESKARQLCMRLQRTGRLRIEAWT